MREPALTPEEARLLAAIVRGGRQNPRNRHLVRLSHLRLIMLKGASLFVPTALGYDWSQRHAGETHGDSQEGGN